MSEKKGITDDEIVEALRVHGTTTAAASALGCHHSNIVRRRKALVLRGLWKPDDKIVPHPYHVKGKSILYDRNGEERMAWVKADVRFDDIKEKIQQVVEGFKDEITRVGKGEVFPQNPASDLLNLFILTDFHLGLKAWHEETGGEDWDLQIAEDFMIRWMECAMERMPSAEVCVFAQLGDFLHWDGMLAVTPQSKHVLDADTRFGKLIRVAIRLTRYIISKLLTKHNKVVVMHVPGNHDQSSAPWLAELTETAYELDDRVIVEKGTGLYFSYEHGSTSLFFHHGDKRRGLRLADTLVSMYREVFGRTKYSYAHTGHLHSHEIKEGVMVIEQHRTMSPLDAYAAGGGWRSGRDAKIITYSKNYGEVARVTVTPEMIKAGNINYKK